MADPTPMAGQSASAASRSVQGVFETVELLEAILMKLPTPDLLQDMRICRRWREVINESPKLRQKLFFEPTGSVSTAAYLGSPDPLQEFNPFVQRPGVGFGDATNIARIGSSALPSSFGYPDASWRRMILTQPPAASVSLWVNHQHVFQSFCSRHEIYDARGVTMEQYVKTLDSIAEIGHKPRRVTLRCSGY